MKRLPLFSVLLVLFVCDLGSQTPAVTAIRCGRLFDGKTLVLQENVVLLMQGDRIQAVGKSLAVDGNPVENIAVMTRLTFVMKNGVVYKAEHLKSAGGAEG
ncbi:MAG: hypothetical protein ACREBC_30585 [Pyrinomonadaceae bacterium]